VVASGFSQNTCLPALIEAVTSSSCAGPQVATTTASTSSRPIREGDYLAIERSDFGLYSIDGRLPVFRLDFRRDMHTVPACHWNVHAESGPATRLLTLGNPDHSGAFAKLHFPVGGPRMRPCLEDFLGILLHEFGVDRLSDASRILCEGRERWRRRQIGTAVRDAPEEAARVLEELGYTVSEPPGGPAPVKVDKLRVW